MTASHLCSENAGNGNFILNHSYKKPKREMMEKLLGTVQRTCCFGNYTDFLAGTLPSPSHISVLPALFRSQQGHDTPCLTFSLPSLGLTMCSLTSVNSLGASASSPIYNCSCALWDFSVTSPVCPLFGMAPWLLSLSHFCSLFLLGPLPSLILLHQIVLLVLIPGFYPIPLGCCLFPSVFLPYSSSSPCTFGFWYLPYNLCYL